jgi:signal transduction histidine kinase
LAHDLKNYLAPLKLRVELLFVNAERAGRTHDGSHAAIALHQIDRVTKLIEDLLDASRIEQGLFTVHPQPTDLLALIQAEAETLSTPETHVQVRGPLVRAMVDPDRIRQAIHNLLSNALQHAPGQPVEIELRMERRDHVPWVFITVTDRGAGIPEARWTQIFECFSGSKSGGLGLGLYLARQIARSHGGDIVLDTTYKQGARFEFSVPLGHPNQPQPAGAAA